MGPGHAGEGIRRSGCRLLRHGRQALFWFGWTVHPSIPPIGPKLAGLPLGCGIILISVAFQAFWSTFMWRTPPARLEPTPSCDPYLAPLFRGSRCRGSALLLGGIGIAALPAAVLLQALRWSAAKPKPICDGFPCFVENISLIFSRIPLDERERSGWNGGNSEGSKSLLR